MRLECSGMLGEEERSRGRGIKKKLETKKRKSERE